MGLLIWIALSGSVVYGLARLLCGNLESRWWRRSIALVLFPVVFIAPLKDEVIGKRQFDQLCEAADRDARIYETLPVGTELYTPDGKWRGFSTGDNPWKIGELADSLMKRESTTTYLQMAIPIQQYDTKVFPRNSGRLLAEWRVFGTSGGWFGRSLGTPILVRNICYPKLINLSSITQQLLPFSKDETK
jgi:hypothetical protein